MAPIEDLGLDPNGDDYGVFEEALLRATKRNRGRYQKLTKAAKTITTRSNAALRAAANRRMDLRWKDLSVGGKAKMKPAIRKEWQTWLDSGLSLIHI